MKRLILVLFISVFFCGCENGETKNVNGTGEKFRSRENSTIGYNRRTKIETSVTGMGNQIGKSKIRNLAKSAAINAGVPANIFWGIVLTENGSLNPFLERDEIQLCIKHGWDWSECRSLGITQVIYGYWKELCKLSDPEQLREESISLNCGAKVFRHYIDMMGGNIPRAVSAYNDGVGKTLVYRDKVYKNAGLRWRN